MDIPVGNVAAAGGTWRYSIPPRKVGGERRRRGGMAALSSLRSFPLCSTLRQPCKEVRVRAGQGLRAGARCYCTLRGGRLASSMAEASLQELRLSEDGRNCTVGTQASAGNNNIEVVKGSDGKKKLEDLRWDHSLVRELPADKNATNSLRQVFNACYSRVSPSVKVSDPKLVAYSESVAELLELDPREFERPEFPQYFSGAKELPGSATYAQCYGGHQFGVWAGQLGDGRAITLGEVLNSKNERWELQLKGAGKTPYSRMADGLAVLRSSIREFLCSEAMHYLGIPTTRALCIVTSGESVVRDMFYDGNPKLEPGAVVCRVAPSFLRFGSYQIHAAREDNELVQMLADYTIKYHFPHLAALPAKIDPDNSKNGADEASSTQSTSDEQAADEASNTQSTSDEQAAGNVDVSKNKYAAWLAEVADITAVLVAKWQAVGFTHGVLNTDNMSVIGLTIDYGPFGFLDAFDPKYTPNTTDLPGRRYCFANQPDIGLWNVMQFANTLLSCDLVSQSEAQHCLNSYADKFMVEYQRNMTDKLGLKEYNKELTSKLLSNLAFDKVDYTNFFRALANVKLSDEVTEETLVPLKSVLLDISKERKKTWVEWLGQYKERATSEGISDSKRKIAMDRVNPKYILRNYLCQSAIDAAEQGDYSEVRQLLNVMKRPYEEQPGMERYARLPPAWAYRPGVCMLSCSS